MRPERVRRQNTHLAIVRVICVIMPITQMIGTKPVVTALIGNQRQWVDIVRTLLVYLTCTAMFGNGWKIVITVDTRVDRVMAALGQMVHASTVSCEADPGTTYRSSRVLLFVAGTCLLGSLPTTAFELPRTFRFSLLLSSSTKDGLLEMTKTTFLASLLLLSLNSLAEELSGKVVGITDGDTLTLLVDQNQYKIRLAEIDTPEKGQPWGKYATQALAEKVFKAEIRVQVVDVDRYGRTVGRIWLEERDIVMPCSKEYSPGFFTSP